KLILKCKIVNAHKMADLQEKCQNKILIYYEFETIQKQEIFNFLRSVSDRISIAIFAERTMWSEN
ncbi:MAG: hypothetical protein PUG15_04620, partial [Bacteroidales bacterium]|nr:hypothetical protein [Bacteroidales bacterium]